MLLTLFVATLVASCSQGGPSSTPSPTAEWSTYDDPNGLFSAELPTTWKFQRYDFSSAPSYPISQGVVFADPASPILPAVASSSADPTALADALSGSGSLFIMINVSKTLPPATPGEIATGEEERSKGLSGYRFLELDTLQGVDGSVFSYDWTPSSGVEQTVTEAFISSQGHMLYLLAGATSDVYVRQSSVVDHFLSTIRTS
jgi:hypothetical protein